MKFKFENMQQLGRALMLPIALLPVAGILLRVGQPDLLNLQYLANAGDAIFTHLSLLFALGVAVGLAKDNNGTAALAAAVGYFIMTTITFTLNKNTNTGVLGGVLVGYMAAKLYNRYYAIELPAYLAFFGGKRFVPIITGISAVFLGVLLGYIWPPIEHMISIFGIWLLKSGPLGLFLYGVLNRLLLITGLHHILNNLVWFVLGDFKNVTGVVVHGDIARFMSGDKTAGFFMSGYFPIMMFGLPAACLAMYKNARQENKKAVAGLLLSMALTSFLTGVTEPIEFSFVFLAPLLFLIHAVLTGLSMAVMYILDVHLGFTFSAGLIDYVLFFKQAVNPVFLLPIGAAFFGVYYFTFNFAICYFNLMTPGRGSKPLANSIHTNDSNGGSSRALQFILSLGGPENLVYVDACVSRLRLQVKDSANIDRDKLMALGARGIVAPTTETLQVVLGPIAEIISGEIRDELAKDSSLPTSHLTNNLKVEHAPSLRLGNTDEVMHELAIGILQAMGGKSNIESYSMVALTRLRFVLINEAEFKPDSLPQQVKLIPIDSNIKQIYLGNNTEAVYSLLSAGF